MTGFGGLPLLALGAGGAIATVALLRRDGHEHPRSGAPVVPGDWVFPVPDLGGRRPEISDGFSKVKTSTHRQHLGVDIMFRRRDRRDLVETYRPGTPNGTPGYFMPDDVPALSAGAGIVTYAAWTVRGYTVMIRHRSGITTYSTHLASLAVTLGQHVDAGQPIGTIGGDPTDARHLMHLHIEVWIDGRRASAVDPAPYLLAGARRAVTWSPPSAPRNGGMRYRPIGFSSERYPEWMQELRGKSGVYVIRERTRGGKPVIVYVGESHTDRLYETMTRHFQRWRRGKKWWVGRYRESDHDPGLTYDRGQAEVAARVTAPSDAYDEETRAIQRLHPRDNLNKQPTDAADLEAAPF